MFGEKKTEYSVKRQTEIPVWQSDKYIESRSKAIEIIKSGKYDLTEADFWILMNETKSGKMAYTGLIISHNGCLKINDKLSDKFRPNCVSWDKDGYGGSLVYTYVCEEQGIFEVGEVNANNCKIAYPYAMALKRCFDRVVLKLSKLAFSGIYSEAEADEFRHEDEPKEVPKEVPKDVPQEMYFTCADCGAKLVPYKGNSGKEVSIRQHVVACEKKFGRALCLDCIAKLNKGDEQSA